MTEYCLPKATAIPNFVSVYDTEKESKLTTTSLTFGDTVYGDGEITGQVEFAQSPLVPEPFEGKEAANKNYVDGLVGQRSGGLILFLNYEDGAGTLSPIPCDCALETVSTTGNLVGTDQTIATFTTAAGYPGVKILPVGNITWTQYGKVSSAEGTVFYQFKLSKVRNGQSIEIGTSSPSAQVNSLYASAYTMALVLTNPEPLLLTDSLKVELIHSGNSQAVVSSYFNGERFSYLQTTLVAGTSLLNTDNTWTNANYFPTPASTDNSTLVATTAYVQSALSALKESAEFTALSTVTQTASVSSTLVATTAYVTNAIATALSGSSSSSSGTPIYIRPVQTISSGPAYIDPPTQKYTFATAWIRPTTVLQVPTNHREIWLPEITSANSHLFEGFSIRIRSDHTALSTERNDTTFDWRIRSVNNVYLVHSNGQMKLPLVNFPGNYSSAVNFVNLTSGHSAYKFLAFDDGEEMVYMWIQS